MGSFAARGVSGGCRCCRFCSGLWHGQEETESEWTGQSGKKESTVSQSVLYWIALVPRKLVLGHGNIATPPLSRFSLSLPDQPTIWLTASVTPCIQLTPSLKASPGDWPLHKRNNWSAVPHANYPRQQLPGMPLFIAYGPGPTFTGVLSFN